MEMGQEDFHEFQDRLVYTVSSSQVRINKATSVRGR